MRHPSLLLCLLLAGSSQAATLSGHVRTADGLALPQLSLTISGVDPAAHAGQGAMPSPGSQPAASAARRVVTGPEGRYVVTGLVPGDYTLSTDAPGLVLHASVRVDDRNVALDLTPTLAPIRERVIVAATREPAALSTLGVSASVLDREQIESRQAATFLDLLSEIPGMAVARTGGVGPQSSVFVRGGESNFARVLVDGVPVNEPGGDFNFGPQLPLELERVEVVRGAASSLYGTDALAGVIQLVTRHGDTGQRGELEFGSFDWRRVSAGASGVRRGLDWSLGAQRLETDNQQPNGRFTQNTGALSLGVQAGDATTLRLIARGEDTEHGAPGQTGFGRPDLDASFDRQALVLGARIRHVRGRVAHELHAGLARSNWLAKDPLDSGAYVPRRGDQVSSFGSVSDFPDPLGFKSDTDRLSLGYQAELEAGKGNLIAAGGDLERETGETGALSSLPLLAPRRTNVGGYVQDRLLIGSRTFLTAGMRLEHNGSFGTRAVPRVAVAYRVRGGDDASTLRASAGLGIKEPSFFESFGVDFYARGNPALKPERSRTLDAGIEQRAFGGRLRAEATAFAHDYRDLIAYTVLDFSTFQGSFDNVGHARGRGLELALEAAPRPGVAFSAAYTFLDSKVLVSSSDFDPVYAVGRPLVRRPRHQGSFGARVSRGRISAGADVFVVGKRADSDFLGIGLLENPGYTRLDARLRVRVVRGVEAFVAADNLLDRSYEEVLGYPALGRSVRAGLRLARK